MNILDDASLEFLTNPAYHHLKKRNNGNHPINDPIDVRFYRKRISSLVKDLMKLKQIERTTSTYSLDLCYTFDIFLKNAIASFKMVDTGDILQERYGANLDQVKDDVDVPDVSFNLTELDINTNKVIQVPTMETYIIRSQREPVKKKIIPIKLDINLHSPELRMKGVTEKIVPVTTTNESEMKK